MEVLISVLIGLGLMELYAWLDPFAKWLVRRVAQKLPEHLQADFMEQFIADLNEFPNSITKVFLAIRDGTLAANSIYDAAYRNAITAVVDELDSTLEKISGTQAALEKAREMFELKWGPGLKYVSTVDQSLRAFRERESQIDVEAKIAVENFQSASAPIVDFFSTTEAIFEQRMTELEAFTARLTEPLPIMHEVSAKLRDRLLDPRPFSPRDANLMEYAAKASGEFASATTFTLPTTPPVFPQRPANLTAQLQAASHAATAVNQAILRRSTTT
jgi:hypothetical protein